MGKRRPFDDLRRALHDISQEVEPAPRLRLDPERVGRTGVPEVILADSKPPDLVIESLSRLAEATGRVMASRCDRALADLATDRLSPRLRIEWHEEARAIIASQPGRIAPSGGGAVGVITAGASDGPVAAEAALMATEMGARVTLVRDVGVAGLQRLVQPLERLIDNGVDALIVAAGMDAAIVSVVAGLVPVPVIGLPTSVGYGYGGKGEGALMSMLQACAPGVVVVNIDNGIGAGAAAALIANRAGCARTTNPGNV
jgi:NCAIR mutase (PurE)-related protein